jgi:hypothetical protein
MAITFADALRASHGDNPSVSWHGVFLIKGLKLAPLDEPRARRRLGANGKHSREESGMSANQHNHRVISITVAVTLLLAGLATIVFGDIWIGVAAVAVGVVVSINAAVRIPHDHRLGS